MKLAMTFVKGGNDGDYFSIVIAMMVTMLMMMVAMTLVIPMVVAITSVMAMMMEIALMMAITGDDNHSGNDFGYGNLVMVIITTLLKISSQK